MKVSLNWLTDYVDVTMPVAELSDLLMSIGLNVEGIEETDTDIVLDLEITSNRPDCLGHIGVARELAAATGKPLKLPEPGAVATAGPVAAETSVEVLDAEFCPRYTARLLRGVKIAPSPAWLIERLEAVGLRSINNVVDATNYVLMEYSQPLHVFDFDKLAGRRIVVRRAVDGEQITAIDGSRHELRDWMGIIADAERPVAVAGVMGGLDTEVSESTGSILIESAVFDPLSIRRTSRYLSLMSESSYRFERAVDPVALERASLRACELIVQTGGGELLAGVVDVWAQPYQGPKVSLRPARCEKLLGIAVAAERQVEILASLGLSPTVAGEAIDCSIPPHRSDLRREVDLIEEVARIHGYHRIGSAGKVTHHVTPPARQEAARQATGEVLNAAGYFEAITFTFIDAPEAELVGWSNNLTVDPRLRKRNGVLRQGLLPSLLRARKANQDSGNEDVHLFELAAVFPPAEDGGDVLPGEYTQLALLSDGSLRDVRGAVEAVVRWFDPNARIEVRPAEPTGFAPGAAAELLLDAGAMVRFDLLTDLGQTARTYRAVPRFPAVKRDLSVVVDESVAWEALAGAITTAAGGMMSELEYVGTYRGKQVGAGRKSVTMRLTYRHPERTLRHEEVDASVAAAIDALRQQHHAELRV